MRLWNKLIQFTDCRVKTLAVMWRNLHYDVQAETYVKLMRIVYTEKMIFFLLSVCVIKLGILGFLYVPGQGILNSGVCYT